MQFGRFDDEQKEYCITTPFTPYPWINYLGNDDFYSIISHTAGGYCFYRDALLRRITRYRYNNVPLDNTGRLFYLADGGITWSPSWKPVQAELDSYECRHGLGYTKIHSSKNSLAAELLFFVPRQVNCEIQQLTLTNNSAQIKEIKLFAMIEFCLWNAQDDMNNFQRNFSTGEVEIEPGVIYHKTEYRERRNHYSFYAVNQKPDGFDSDRESFLGLHNSYDKPIAVQEGRPRNSVADGWSPIAAHFFNLKLKPGEKKTLIFVLGYIENEDEEKWERPGVINKKKAHQIIEHFSKEENVKQAFNELKSWWEKLLSVYTLESSSVEVNRMVNIWNQYQCIITFRISRSASYFESGIGRGIGFRDTNQDLLGCMHQIPALARQRILDVAATQLANGGAFHQYQPLTKRGNNAIGSNFNDDPLWLILSVSSYLKETGDWAILDEKIDFENDPTQAAPLFEHLKRAFHYITDRKGPHGLPLIGRADWNDCLNLNCYSKDPTDSFQTVTNKDGKTAESVLIAGMFVFIGREYAEIARRKGFKEEADFAEAEIAQMAKTVEEKGWDKEWYLRAYDDAGQKIGSAECEDGKILIESQGFCAMAEIGKEKNYPLKALDSVAKHLATEHGIVLVWPAYKKYYLNLGEISSYPPGYKENGGIFCHNNPWLMIAEAIANRPQKAFNYYKLICPAYREKISELHRLEPYVYAQMIAGKEAKRFGEAKNSWLTGTAAWNFVAISQWILGVRPDYDGLLVNPKLPAELENVTVKRVFRGVSYEIKMKKKNKETSRVVKAYLDGKELSVRPDGSVLIPLAEVSRPKVNVELELE